ncbi:MAG: permease-like cell division protein FtsX [Candidatus Nomurabacteria bacterium]|nr:permease-like cell division protein FtsX [Candidatus Nomurabacteria bacterium]
MTELKRIIKAGFVNFSRNGIISWSAVLVITITLSVITSLIFLQAVLHSSLDQIKDKVDVTVYFTTEAQESDIMSLKSNIEKLPEVASTIYVSSEEALQTFRDRHQNDYPTIQALDEIGSNPLGGYLNIKAKEVNQYESIANFLKGDDALVSGSTSIVDKVNYNQNKLVIDRLSSIIGGAEKLGFIITLVLSLISLIIAYNTIRLAIFMSREEISVMRLVGASKFRIRGPFMIEGLIYGFIATVLTMLIFWPTTVYFGNNMSSFLGMNIHEYFTSNFFQIFIIVLLSGILLGMISSFFAVRKYLNK